MTKTRAMGYPHLYHLWKPPNDTQTHPRLVARILHAILGKGKSYPSVSRVEKPLQSTCGLFPWSLHPVALICSQASKIPKDQSSGARNHESCEAKWQDGPVPWPWDHGASVSMPITCPLFINTPRNHGGCRGFPVFGTIDAQVHVWGTDKFGILPQWLGMVGNHTSTTGRHVIIGYCLGDLLLKDKHHITSPCRNFCREPQNHRKEFIL